MKNSEMKDQQEAQGLAPCSVWASPCQKAEAEAELCVSGLGAAGVQFSPSDILVIKEGMGKASSCNGQALKHTEYSSCS